MLYMVILFYLIVLIGSMFFSIAQDTKRFYDNDKKGEEEKD